MIPDGLPAFSLSAYGSDEGDFPEDSPSCAALLDQGPEGDTTDYDEYEGPDQSC